MDLQAHKNYLIFIVYEIQVTVKNAQVQWSDELHTIKVVSMYAQLFFEGEIFQIHINPVNDPPELSEVRKGEPLRIAARGSRLLTTAALMLTDPDDGPEKV